MLWKAIGVHATSCRLVGLVVQIRDGGVHASDFNLAVCEQNFIGTHADMADDQATAIESAHLTGGLTSTSMCEVIALPHQVGERL